MLYYCMTEINECKDWTKVEQDLQQKVHKLYNNLLGNKFKNRCVFSTKARAVTRLTNLTKASFNENLKWGKLNGFKKASW